MNFAEGSSQQRIPLRAPTSDRRLVFCSKRRGRAFSVSATFMVLLISDK